LDGSDRGPAEASEGEVTGGLRVRLFGKFLARPRHEALESRKAQELLGYLLLHPNRPHTRERLASLLWDIDTTPRARSYLRKAVWQLQTVLMSADLPTDRALLSVDNSWITLRTSPRLWVDLHEFEAACRGTKEQPGRALVPEQVRAMERAVALYRGDFLEGWYADWCLTERERLQHEFCVMVDKLMDHCREQGEHERGVAFGARILGIDRAHERTHRKMMHLYHLSGDRSSAIRQFDRCRSVLQAEFGVTPTQQTIDLNDAIRGGDRDVASRITGEDAPLILGQLLDLRTRVVQVLDEIHGLIRELGGEDA
jgi:DNA-binding SARP family transcriptional activator